VRRGELTAGRAVAAAVGLLVGVLLVSIGVPNLLVSHHRRQLPPVCRKHQRKHCRRKRKRVAVHLVVPVVRPRVLTTIIPAPPPDPNLWPAPGPVDPSAPQPQLVDPIGTYTFCGADSLGLLAVCQGGNVVSAYVDDTDPNRDQNIAAAVNRYGWMIAGQAPEGPCPSQSGVICAREWYPFDCRYAPGTWGPLPSADAYIVQWWFAWPGCGPPTPAERESLLAKVEALHPELILLY
jgi:hypothetical protein